MAEKCPFYFLPNAGKRKPFSFLFPQRKKLPEGMNAAEAVHAELGKRLKVRTGNVVFSLAEINICPPFLSPDVRTREVHLGGTSERGGEK